MWVEKRSILLCVTSAIIRNYFHASAEQWYDGDFFSTHLMLLSTIFVILPPAIGKVFPPLSRAFRPRHIARINSAGYEASSPAYTLLGNPFKMPRKVQTYFEASSIKDLV